MQKIDSGNENELGIIISVRRKHYKFNHRYHHDDRTWKRKRKTKYRRVKEIW